MAACLRVLSRYCIVLYEVAASSFSPAPVSYIMSGHYVSLFSVYFIHFRWRVRNVVNSCRRVKQPVKSRLLINNVSLLTGLKFMLQVTTCYNYTSYLVQVVLCWPWPYDLKLWPFSCASFRHTEFHGDDVSMDESDRAGHRTHCCWRMGSCWWPVNMEGATTHSRLRAAVSEWVDVSTEFGDDVAIRSAESSSENLGISVTVIINYNAVG